MQKLTGILLIGVLLFGCGPKEDPNKFTVKGNVKNLPDQQVYLEQVYFSDKNPEILDTAEVKNGQFELSAIAPQQGMFRVLFEKEKILFLVINDKPALDISADAKTISPTSIKINTPANASLYSFINETNKRGEELDGLAGKLRQLEAQSDTSAIANDPAKEYQEKEDAFRDYVYAYVDTCSSSAGALFALGFVRQPPGDRVQKAAAALAKRFAGSNEAAAVLNMVNAERQQASQTPAASAKIPQPGDMAPEITMPDTEGKMFSLSSLRGKYVLVDFWASWCGPCRAENPNVVEAYEKYNNKNFTILGVSLDKSKDAWLEAIKKDGLAWKHISDLKQWDSEAQRLYQFQGIPYNVLIDPQGKIIATELRGADLANTLEKVLR